MKKSFATLVAALAVVVMVMVPSVAFAERDQVVSLGSSLEGTDAVEPGAPDPAGALLKAQATCDGTRQAFLEVVGEQEARSYYGDYDNDVEYNGWNGEPWCGHFVAWCARVAGVSTDYIPSADTAKSVPRLASWFGDDYHSSGGGYEPKAGDIAFLDNNGHVGVVVGRSGSDVIVKEGNVGNGGANDEVQVNTYWRSGGRICGYGETFMPERTPEERYYGPTVGLPAGDGTYSMATALDPRLFVEVAGGQTGDGAVVRLWPGEDEEQRLWDFTRNGDGTYTIANHRSGKVIDVWGLSRADGGEVRQAERNGGDNQRFWLEDCGGGVYALKAKHSGKYLDVRDAVAENGREIQQCQHTDSDAQRFIISPSYGLSTSLPKGGGLQGATYTLSTALNPDLLVGPGAKNGSGGVNVQLCGRADSSLCRWDFVKNDDGTYTIRQFGTDKVLDVYNVSLNDGATVHIWLPNATGKSDNQRFWIEECGGGVYALKAKHSGKFLDVRGGEAEAGASIQQFRGSWSDSQRFRIESWANDLSAAEIAPIGPQPWLGVAVEPRPEVRLGGVTLTEGVDYELSWSGNAWPGEATVTATGIGDYAGSKTVGFTVQGYDHDEWVTLASGAKAYARGGKLVTGWMDLGSSKYWFGADGAMATGWTDVVVNGKTMHYYFNPASGNLVRGTWFEIDGYKYYFRPSGNVAHGWATVSDNGVDKKYFFDDDYHMVTGWQEIEVNGKAVRYYFRPSGSMATGWATIDGFKYWFRPSGSMATGFATVSDGTKRYFDEEGHMVTDWRDIGGRRYYFRVPSGAMQTGRATIDGKEYEFTDSGTLKSAALSAQSDEGEAGLA